MSEVRLIDANAAFKALSEEAAHRILHSDGKPFDCGRTNGIILARDIMAKAPTITPESLGYRKVVHGRWENTVKWWQGGSAWKRCSVCGIISEKTRYCRNCGARMIEKTDCLHQG